MRDVDQITIQARHDGSALQMPAHGIGGKDMDCFEIFREFPYLGYLLCRPQEKICVFAIKPRQRANDVARVSAYAELIHPANINGNLHICDFTHKECGWTQAEAM